MLLPTQPTPLARYCQHYYGRLMLAMLVLASVLRFWALDNVPVAYFDEINVPQFGWALLNGARETPFVTAHPPLTHYLFAAAIWLYYLLAPWAEGSATQAWASIDPVSFRWLTALLGVLCVYFAGDGLRRLTGSALAGLLLAFFVAIDGSLVVDSRAGLNNIVMLCLGLAAVWCWLRAALDVWHRGWMLAAGALLGCVVSVKWNGLGFWLLPVAVLGLQWARWLFDHYRPVGAAEGAWRGPDPVWVGLSLVLVPLAVYWLCWQPYLAFEQRGFLEVHRVMQSFHTQQVGANDHPYCSAWYQWPWQGRPMSYLFELQPEGEKIYRVIHQLGNPLLYPLSLLAVLVAAGALGANLWHWFSRGTLPVLCPQLMPLVLGWAANFLPWVLVSRCLFSYHYQPASVFSFAVLACGLALALAVPVRTPVQRSAQIASIAALGLVLAAWLYWLPLAVGYPISLDSFYQHMWLNSWI